jgi:hypothetical protein
MSKKDRYMSKQPNTEQKPVEDVAPADLSKTEDTKIIPEVGKAEADHVYGDVKIVDGKVVHGEVAPVTESKPVQNMGTAIPVVGQKPVAVKAQTTAAIPLNVRKLNGLIKAYEDKIPLQSRSDRSQYDSINAMIDLCNYLNRINDPAVFEAFLKYFQRNQNPGQSMDYEVALNGIFMIQNKNTKTRVSATHSCFLELAELRKSLKKRKYGYTVTAMKAMEISEPLAQWILAKAASRN